MAYQAKGAVDQRIRLISVNGEEAYALWWQRELINQTMGRDVGWIYTIQNPSEHGGPVGGMRCAKLAVRHLGMV